MEKKRQVNFELLRILCMYMIVIGHCLFHGRVTAKLGYGTVNYFLSYLVQSFSVVHVNCFVMIGGYFLIDSEFRLRRILRLWRQVAFYAVSICLLYGLLAGVTANDICKAIFPISTKSYWFASVYMGLLLLMPFAGRLAAGLTRAQYRLLLLILALLLSVNHMIFQVDAYGVYEGRELSWFLFLALLAGYEKRYLRTDRRFFWYGLLGYGVSALAVLLSVYVSAELGLENTTYFMRYNSPLALCASFSLFTAVRNLSWRESRADRLIRRAASAAFGVYLIHDHYLIRYLVWDTFRASKVARTHWAVIYAAFAAVIVYVVCSLLELLRQRLFALAAGWYEGTLLYRKEQALCGRVDRIFGRDA